MVGKMKKMSVLFVCTGNTCRSPMACGLFKQRLIAEGIEGVKVTSAGLAAVTGAPASENAMYAASLFGADISQHRSTHITRYLLDESDLVVCMTGAMAQALAPYVEKERLFVLRGEIPDPFAGDRDEYIRCAERINSALGELTDLIKAKEGKSDEKK